MVLKPLEFSDCLLDSPYFRENLHSHEKELERTSRAIKSLIQECKDLLNAAKNLSKAQRSFSSTLTSFEFECIGEGQTEEETTIANSLKQFGTIISHIEEQRDILLDKAYEHFILPLETFRKEHIGSAKEGRKKFEKETGKFYQSLERYLSQKSNKGTETQIKEADAALQMERKHFYQASMSYVLTLQEVQERKKFEFVEPLLGFMLQWLTFYHQGQDIHNDFKPYMNDLQYKIQKTRENFNAMQEEAEQLMNKMLEKPAEQPPPNKAYTKQGYLFMQEKSKLSLSKALGTTWTKYFCQYEKETKQLRMLQYSQLQGKAVPTHSEDVLTLASCVRRATDSIDKRFCFDITFQDKGGLTTLQAVSEEDRRAWLDAMDGKEPVYSEPVSTKDTSQSASLDDLGFGFVKKCIHAIESRGIEDQGLYRVVGVNSKVNKLLSMGLDRRKSEKVDLCNPDEWEIKTITSALKSYFRTLPEPLMTFNLHEKLIAAAKRDKRGHRVHEVHKLVHQLPKANKDMLETLGKHLQCVAASSAKNLMTVSNVGVCFGPTLMRPREETMAAIMDIKFCNIVVEILIENYDTIFKTDPSSTEFTDNRAPSTANNGRPTVTPTKPPVPAMPPQLVQNRTPAPPSGQTANHRRTSSADDILPNNAPSSPNSGLTGAGAKGVTSPSPSSENNGGYNPNVTYAQVRARLRPTSGLYNQYAAGDQASSNSSSTESLNSRSSNQSSPPAGAKTQPVDNRRQPHIYANVRSQGTNRYQSPSETSGSTASSVSSTSGGLSQSSKDNRRKVRTLYACQAENDSELSFAPNQIIHNVKKSKEPGWLEGSLEGKVGLIPANYVEYLN